jgi:hypothetical protein
MDIHYFLTQRTAFIRTHYDVAVAAFERQKQLIEDGAPPYDNPPYSEDGEPAYLEEWLEANDSIQIVGLTCVSLLADALKLYLNNLQKRRIRFSFDEAEAARHKKHFVTVYREALGEIYETDWEESGVDFAVIEQVVLARNRGQHGTDLTSFLIQHDRRTLTKHRSPIFVSRDEWRDWEKVENPAESLLHPSLVITRETLFAAIDEIDRLATWIENHGDRAAAWIERQQVVGKAGALAAR